MKEFPFCPKVTEAGIEEAEAYIENFKQKLAKAAEEAIFNIYTDIGAHIETDAWENVVIMVIDAFTDYTDNRKRFNKHNFYRLRQKILEEHRDAIIEDLNQDLVKENENLKKELWALTYNSRRY